jgi:hypothetical protein
VVEGEGHVADGEIKRRECISLEILKSLEMELNSSQIVKRGSEKITLSSPEIYKSLEITELVTDNEVMEWIRNLIKP